MAERKKLVVGNWKMNLNVPDSVNLAEKLLNSLEKSESEVVVSPSFASILPVYEILKGKALRIASQDLASEEKGAYTGEVSALSLKGYVSYSIVGHSERRNIFGEDDKVVADKAAMAVRHSIIPIICVGETLHQKEDNLSKVVVLSQVESSCKHLTAEEIADCVIAYEPIWAVGTDKVCDGAEADTMAGEIRGLIKALYGEKPSLAVKILYGGDVNAENVNDFVKRENIDGVLVGRASLDADSFGKIVKAFTV